MRDKLTKFDGMIVPVITGFVGTQTEIMKFHVFNSMMMAITFLLGHDSKGRITTLGRGGSDLTATVVGSAYPVDEIQVESYPLHFSRVIIILLFMYLE